MSESKHDRISYRINDDHYHQWINKEEKSWRENQLKSFDHGEFNDDWPLISIVIPTYNTPETFLREAIQSVINQHYPNWQLCIADDASTDAHVKSIIEEYVKQDKRITAVFCACNSGIAVATNAALSKVTGQYVAFMDHDDKLTDHALLSVAIEVKHCSATQILYSDSDELNEEGCRSNPFFKPDWNYELFLGQNYINHLTVYRADLLRELSGLREGFDGSQDYDLALRAIERVPEQAIRHIPHVLYHWRVVPSSVSRSNLGQAVKVARSAIREHLQRLNSKAIVGPVPGAVIYNHIRWAEPTLAPKISVIVHGSNQAVIAESVMAIRAMTKYRNYSVSTLMVEACSEIYPSTGLGRRLNAVVSKLNGEVLCFIKAGLSPMSDDWLSVFAAQSVRPSVGLVGPKFISTDDLIESGALIVDSEANCDSPILLSFRGSERASKGYFSRLVLDQQVSALHGACLAVKSDVFKRVGGWDSELSSMALLGADLSLKITAGSMSVIWTANTMIRVSGDAKEDFITPTAIVDSALFTDRWSDKLGSDRHYNNNFCRAKAEFTL